MHFLGEHGSDESLLANHLSPIRLDLAVDHPQQGGLARTIATQQAHPLGGFDLKIGFIEDQRPAKAQTHVT